MKNEFVPYAEALALEKLGFDEECFSWFTEFGEIYGVTTPDPTDNPDIGIKNSDRGFENKITECAAPVYQQAFRWFRDEHNLHGEVHIMAGSDIWGNRMKGKEKVYHYWIHDLSEKSWSTGETVSNEYYYSYKEAELACIREMIKIVKEKC